MSLIGVIDTETTGNDVTKDEIIEVAIVFIRDGVIDGSYEQRIRANKKISAKALEIHGIADADLIGEPTFAEVATDLYKTIKECDVLVGHNATGFDVPILFNEFKRVGIFADFPPCIDTMMKGRGCTADGKVPSLKEYCWAYGVDYDEEEAHAALYDCEVLAKAFLNLMRMSQ